MGDNRLAVNVSLPLRSKLVYHVLTPVVFILFVSLGWYVVLRQGHRLTQSALTLFRRMELEMARSAADNVEQYIAAHPSYADGLDNALEREVFSRYVASVALLDESAAWMCAPDHTLVSLGSESSTVYYDQGLGDLFVSWQDDGASHYEELVAAVTAARAGTGWFVWNSTRGREVAAWAPAQVGEQSLLIVFSVPQSAVLKTTGVADHILLSAIALPVVTVVSAALIFIWRRLTMQQWKMYQMLYQRERFLNLLNDITWTALAKSDDQDMMHSLVGRLSALYEADGCCLIYWDEATDSAGQIVRCGGKSHCTNGEASDGDVALAMAVLSRRQPLAIEDVGDTFYADTTMARDDGQRALLCLPLIASERRIGVLVIGWRHPRQFDEQEISWAGLAARHIALAMDKNQLLSNAQRQARELALLHDVSLAAASNVRLEDTLQAAAEALAVEWQATLVSLMLINESGDKLDIIASVGYPDDFYEKYTAISLGEGITGWVAQYGEPLLIPDVRRDSRYIAGSPKVRSEICVPLIAGHEVIGVLNVESPKLNAFTDHDQQLLTTLASNLVVLLERARLFEALMSAQEELKQQAVALQEYAAELEARNEELDAFAHTVAHDLKASLSFVVGYAEVLAEDYDDIPPEQRQRAIDAIFRAGYKMVNVIDELMLLAGLRRAEVVPGPVLMEHVVSEARARLRAFIESHEAEIISPDTWPLALGYGPWLEEVWVNYISNAIKYGGRPPHIELGADLLPDGRVRFWVRDNGAGIPPERQADLFSAEPHLYQARFGGHGLGLSIVQRIVERLGGEVGVESVVGEGSLFYFILPGVD